jgi:hypothetical protein
LAHEVKNLKHDLQLNGFPQNSSTQSSIIPGKNQLRNDVKPIGSVVIPYVKGISDKFKRNGNLYNIRTIFKTKYTIRNPLMRTRHISVLHLTAHFIYNIPSECGRSYVVETGRLLSVKTSSRKIFNDII